MISLLRFTLRASARPASLAAVHALNNGVVVNMVNARLAEDAIAVGAAAQPADRNPEAGEA